MVALEEKSGGDCLSSWYISSGHCGITAPNVIHAEHVYFTGKNSFERSLGCSSGHRKRLCKNFTGIQPTVITIIQWVKWSSNIQKYFFSKSKWTLRASPESTFLSLIYLVIAYKRKQQQNSMCKETNCLHRQQRCLAVLNLCKTLKIHFWNPQRKEICRCFLDTRHSHCAGLYEMEKSILWFWKDELYELCYLE